MNTVSIPVYRNGKSVRRLQLSTGMKGVLISVTRNPLYRGRKKEIVNDAEDAEPMDYIGLIDPVHMAVIAEFLKTAKNDIIQQEDRNAEND